MTPSIKKRPTNRVVSKTQDQKLQDKTKQPINKQIERNRLKMVLRNLSLLKLLRSSNQRIQELHGLARRCWNSLFRVPKILTSSGGNDVHNNVRQNDEEDEEIPSSASMIEARPLENFLESEKAESVGESKAIRPKEGSEGSPAAVPQQMGPEVPTTSQGHGVSPGAQRRPHTTGPGVMFLKTCPYTIPMGHKKLPAVAGQFWFKGLPTRIHLPGPRVFCRSSALRGTKRRCTRLCSASLQLPTGPPYKVV